MRLRWKIILGLALLAVVAVFFLLLPDNRPRKEVEQTRRHLRQQGFKTELSQFDFSTGRRQTLKGP